LEILIVFNFRHPSSQFCFKNWFLDQACTC
jgi:hypothetical protein